MSELRNELDALTLEFIERWRPTCGGCGYNMTGIDSRVCPECGDALQRARVACPICEYELSGLVKSVCPECGTSLRLVIRCTTELGSSYLASLVVLASGGGFAMTVLLWLVVRLRRDGFSPPFNEILPLFVLFGVAGASILAMLLGRRLWRGFPIEVRVGWLLASIVGVVGVSVWFFVMVQ